MEITELSESNLTSLIHEKLCQKSPIPSKCSIHRVPDRLRSKIECYEPKVVSIGPFHHGKQKLQAMEKIKLWYLHCLLNRAPTKETTLECVIEAIGSIEQECRGSYAGEINFTEKQFIEMMVVDGCFIIEFFRKASVPEEVRRDKDDPVFNTSWMAWEITHDLFLLENQLPWPVLDCLFKLTKSNAEGRSLLNLLNSFPLGALRTRDDRQIQYKLLLDCRFNSYAETYQVTQANHLSFSKVDSIPSVTELVQAGVRFETRQEMHSLNITFKDGVMTLPLIQVSEITLSIFRNLIAFEHCDPSKVYKLSSYGKVLKDLAQTSKDVDFLVQRKILKISLSSHDLVSLGNWVYNDAYDYVFLYTDLYHEVYAYYRCSRNRWRAILKRDYFNNPWTSLSVIAAILILLFSLLQTLCSILTYYRCTPS
ncbi:UPF0481 protein At3g47200-like [Corylus avellana]|uniref:UPF0481 protein At3g47200-like n=1 Tax=Corylus avellana TaxID=13451 RepID=UPI00286CAE84|nr:UPF0481 protein At3g47200-like [Corylus avellana]